MKTRKHNHHNKNHRKTIKIKRGGVLIDKGSYGCIFSPPIKCKTDKERRRGISKLINHYDANVEIKHYEFIDKIDPYGIFHIPLEHVCNFNLETIEPKIDGNIKNSCDLFQEDPLGRDMKLLFFKHGGKDWDTFFTSNLQLSYKQWNLFFSGLYRLFYGLYMMSKHSFIHLDIKWNNIMIQPKTFQSSLIDFGISHTYEGLTKKIEQNHLFGSVYYHFNMPPELSLYNHFVSIASDMVNEKLDNPSQIQYITQFVDFMNKKYEEDKLTKHWDTKLVSSQYYKSKLYKQTDTLKEYLKSLFNHYQYIQKNNQDQVVFEQTKQLYSFFDKYDIYAFGYSLCWLWNFFFKEPFSIQSKQTSVPLYRLKKLIHKMIQPNPLKRIHPKKALLNFIIIWAKFIKHGIQEKKLTKSKDGLPNSVIKLYKQLKKDV